MYKYYIAYGSNLNLRQMQSRCPGATVLGTGFLKGYRLLFKGSMSGSYLTIEKAKESQIPVAVWKVDEANERALDRYEGYPNFYYKKDLEIDVTGIKTGKTYHKQAFVYIMHEERKIGIPSKYYVWTCAEGYQAFGFDIKYLKEALEYSLEVADGNENK